MISVVATVISEIVAAGDKDELHDAVQTGMHHLDFATYNLTCHKQSNHQFMTEPTLTSWSGEDLNVYDTDRWYGRDPLLAYAASDGPPMAWVPQRWHDVRHFAEYAQYLQQFGIRSGVTAPLANRPGSISAITALSFSKHSMTDAVANAVYVIGHAAMLRAEVMGLIQAIRTYQAKDIATLALLSKAQLEILEWVAEGKSNGEIAVITDRSHRVVAYHVSEILRKLGVASRIQAAAVLSAAPGQPDTSRGLPRES